MDLTRKEGLEAAARRSFRPDEISTVQRLEGEIFVLRGLLNQVRALCEREGLGKDDAWTSLLSEIEKMLDLGPIGKGLLDLIADIAGEPWDEEFANELMERGGVTSVGRAYIDGHLEAINGLLSIVYSNVIKEDVAVTDAGSTSGQ